MWTLVSVLDKMPVKKAKKSPERKRKYVGQTPEGAELLLPEKLSKPNTLDEITEAHFIGMLPFCGPGTFSVHACQKQPFFSFAGNVAVEICNDSATSF